MADEAKFYQESDNKFADTTDPRDPSTQEAHNPDAEKRPGTAPVQGEGGERGTSAFDGEVEAGTTGPLKGVDYWEGSNPTGNHS